MPDHRELLKHSRRLRRRRGLGFGVLCAGASAAVLLWLLVFLNSPRFALRTIEVRGNQLIASEELRAATEAVIAGRRWLVLYRDRYWFYPRLEIVAALRQRFKGLGAVAVEALDWRTLRLTVTERRPAALWCPSLSHLESFADAGDCFYLDEDGLAFSAAPRFSWPPLPLLSGSLWKSDFHETMSPAVLSQPWPRSRFVRLLALGRSLEDFFRSTPFDGVEARLINALAGGDYELVFSGRVRPTPLFKIIAAHRQTETEILNFLLSIFDLPSFRDELAAGRALVSIDLRFDGKVFYRFRD